MLKLAVIVVMVLCVQSEGKRFDRCGLVRELRVQGFPEDQMRDWVCLVENESSRYTDKINTNGNGSRDYGLFQINDQYWCSNTTAPGKDCNVTCAELLTDDISKAAQCALKIYRRHKFRAWYGWRSHCNFIRYLLPDISDC